jgi:aminobenzoyl-glutamate utilization protein B
MDTNLRLIGGYSLTKEEQEFGTKIQQTFKTDEKLESTQLIKPFKAITPSGITGSTDVADVSWVVPTVGLSTATWIPGTTAHSWQAVAAGGTSIGMKGMMVASKTLAATAIDFFEKPVTIEEAWKELRSRRGENFKYEALVGDRKPALNYRD